MKKLLSIVAIIALLMLSWCSSKTDDTNVDNQNPNIEWNNSEWDGDSLVDDTVFEWHYLISTIGPVTWFEPNISWDEIMTLEKFYEDYNEYIYVSKELWESFNWDSTLSAGQIAKFKWKVILLTADEGGHYYAADRIDELELIPLN